MPKNIGKACRVLVITVGLSVMPPCLAQQGSDGGSASRLSTKIAQAKASADPNRTLLSRVDGFVQQQVREQNVPAYAIAIIRNGKVVFKKGYGATDLEGGHPVGSDTVFGLASLTKTFTALALLALVDQGKINLDDRLDKYLDGLAKSWQPLTIRQLASMTAGVPVKMDREVAWPVEFKAVQEEPLLFEPGSNFTYSNLSYRTLGTVMERVTGKKYIDILDELIINPLAMTSTGTQRVVPMSRLVWPFAISQGDNAPKRLPPYRDPEIPFAAGMLFSDLDDMITYVQALMDQKILSPAGYKTMWQDRPPLTTGKPSQWAFGWSVANSPAFGNRRLISMNGAIPGVSSSIMIFPDEKAAVVALANVKKRHGIAHGVAQLYFGTEGPAQEVAGSSE